MQQTGNSSHVRALLGPLTDRLERLEQRATRNAADIERVKAAARQAGMRGVRYGLLAALAVVSPRDAIKQLIGYVDAMGGPDDVAATLAGAGEAAPDAADEIDAA